MNVPLLSSSRLTKALARKPGRGGIKEELKSLIQKADCLNAHKKWSDAQQLYEAALRINPRLPQIWVQLGHCHKELGALSAAEVAYKEALRVDNKHSDAALHLGCLLRDRGDRVSAFSVLTDAWQTTREVNLERELSITIGTSSNYSIIDEVMRTFFDPSEYISLNSDVSTSGLEPSTHYLLFGWKEGRAPSCRFELSYYLSKFGRELKPDEMPFVHYYSKGRSLGYRCNPVSESLWFEPLAPAEPNWSTASPAIRTETTRAIVIMPVYKGYNETLSAIYHALQARGDEPYSLLVLNDCGPDKQLNDALENLANKGLFEYHFSSINRGFVKTVNHGIRRSMGYDIVLLNSDAYVYKNWFSRMSAHLDACSSVGTVTPFSNNATICSYPLICHSNNLALEVAPEQIDEIASAVNSGVSIDVPTGVGFCMLIRKKVLDEVGLLDEQTFGHGYGEESDFCMRALSCGYKNVIAADVFVYHVGSVSFSSSKNYLLECAQIGIDKKHPNYGELVSKHIASDPGFTVRREIDLNRITMKFDSGIVFVTHKWDGGIESYIEKQVERLESTSTPYIILRVHDDHYLSVETDRKSGLHVPNLERVDLREDLDFVRRLLSSISVSYIHVNSFAGLSWFYHSAMLDIIASSGIPYKYIIHDYSCVSQFRHLIRPDGIYEDIPHLDRLKVWHGMRSKDNLDRCSPIERIDAYRRFLSGASEIVAPSKSTRDIVNKFHTSFNIGVVPHHDRVRDVAAITRRERDGRLRIVSVGAIGWHKGSTIIKCMAMEIVRRKLPVDLTIVGYSDQDDILRSNGVTITGRYNGDREAVATISRIQPDLLLIPSICPETYCFTLSLAIQMGIPPVVFDLGAQGDRVRELGWGILLPAVRINSPGGLIDELLDADIDRLWRRSTSAASHQTAAVGIPKTVWSSSIPFLDNTK